MAKKVVVLGGGTGTFVVLSGLKKYPLDITGIVPLADSGGPAREGRGGYRGLSLLPQVPANPKAIAAIKEADAIIIGAGHLYTSLLPTLLVGGVSEAVRDSKSSKFFILNLMSRYGQTHGFTASRHASVLEEHLQSPLTHILVNTAELPLEILQFYAT